MDAYLERHPLGCFYDGNKLEEYEILDTLGEGGCGRVLAALCKANGEYKAIKVAGEAADVQIDKATGERHAVLHLGVLGAFNERYVASCTRGCSGVLQIDSFHIDRSGRGVLVMPLCKGGDAAGFLDSRRSQLEDEWRPPANGGLPVGEALALFRLMVDSVSQMKGAGFVHCDVKPQNFFFASAPREDASGSVRFEESVVKLGDFGLAARAVSATQLHAEATAGPLRDLFGGSPGYMAPEVVRRSHGDGSAPVGFAADVWALGVCLYELLTNCKPFDEEDEEEWAKGGVADVRASMRRHWREFEGVPEDARALLCEMLRSDPEERPCVEEVLKRVVVAEGVEETVERMDESECGGWEDSDGDTSSEEHDGAEGKDAEPWAVVADVVEELSVADEVAERQGDNGKVGEEEDNFPCINVMGVTVAVKGETGKKTIQKLTLRAVCVGAVKALRRAVGFVKRRGALRCPRVVDEVTAAAAAVAAAGGSPSSNVALLSIATQ